VAAKTLDEWWPHRYDQENEKKSLAQAIWDAATDAAEEKFTTTNTASTPVCPKCGNAMAVLSGSHGCSGKVCLFCE
jgi:hypothetical protein